MFDRWFFYKHFQERHFQTLENFHPSSIKILKTLPKITAKRTLRARLVVILGSVSSIFYIWKFLSFRY